LTDILPGLSICHGICREPEELSAGRRVRLFKNGRSQALRIPRDMELPGNEAVIRKDGARLIVEPAAKPSLLDLLEEFRRRGQLAPEDRMPQVDRHEAEPVIVDEAGHIRRVHGPTPIVPRRRRRRR